MKRHILFILTLLLFFHAKSQPNCIFTHYSSENGLSQNSIMSMVQDHNGVLWFSTWDGINRFNGYDFKVYKARQGNKITMTNNRVDLLEVDPYNYIWLQTYDYRVYRFDQRTEKFEQIPAEGEEEGMRFSSIKILPDSVIWLLSENEGAVRVKTNPKDYSITTQVYATHSRGGNAVHINQVFSDAYNQEWLLTDNGLLKITNDKEEPVSYFVNIQSGKDEPVQAFYSFCSYGDELYFGSDRGRIWCYSLQNEIFRLWELPLNSTCKCNRILINNLFKFFVWREVSKSFTRSIIEFIFNPLNLFVGYFTKVLTLWDILPDKPVGVFIGTTFP